MKLSLFIYPFKETQTSLKYNKTHMQNHPLFTIYFFFQGPQSGEVTPRSITKQIDGSVSGHSTSNAMYNAVVGPGGISTKGL